MALAVWFEAAFAVFSDESNKLHLNQIHSQQSSQEHTLLSLIGLIHLLICFMLRDSQLLFHSIAHLV